MTSVTGLVHLEELQLFAILKENSAFPFQK
ncbi:hypothetical protein KCTC52924_00172 [Arenibacter antarcticus]